MPTFTEDRLRAVTALIVRRMGSDAEETSLVADHLVRANLAGHDSHGVGMLPAYVRLLQDGLLVPNQAPETVLDFGALLVLDARRGYGQHMAAESVRRAIERARQTGACVLGMRNSSHIGRVGTYGEQAVAAGMAFIGYVNVADHHDIAAPGLCRAAPRHQPVRHRGAGRRGPGAARHGHHHHRRRQGPRRTQQGRPGARRLPDRCERQPNQRSDPVHRRAHRRADRIRPPQGLGTCRDVRDHGRRRGRRPTRRRAQPRRHPEQPVRRRDRPRAHRRRRRAGARRSGGDESAYPLVAGRTGIESILLPGEPERRSAAARRANGIPVDDRTWEQIREAAGKLGITEAELERANV